MSGVTGNMYSTGLPLREPDQRCEACSAQGTVGRATRFEQDGQVREMHRFCGACWPEQCARYKARWMEEDRLATEAFFRSKVRGGQSGPSSSFEAATWHGVLELLRDIRNSMHPHEPPPPPTPEMLAFLANGWRELARDIDEPMPFEIEMFIRQHASAAG